MIEGLVHPPFVPRQVTIGAAEDALSPSPGGRRREPETGGLAASREHEDEGGGDSEEVRRSGCDARGAGPHRRRFRFAARCWAYQWWWNHWDG